MANWTTSFDWMMENEDSLRQYANKPDEPGEWREADGVKTWVGARAISGINSAYFPSQFAVIASLPDNERGPDVENFYLVNFWNNWFEQVRSDEFAKRQFDSGVDQGARTAVEIAQSAVNSLGGDPIGVDGDWGPETINAINMQDPIKLVDAFKQERIKAYARSPKAAIYLGTPEKPGPWYIRAMK